MKNRYLITVVLCCFVFQLKAQHYALFNTRTQLDGFENPAMRTFTLDSSRNFASNFFFPTFNTSASNKGSAQNVMRKLINEGILDASSLPLGTGARNEFFENTNIYLLNVKIFSSYKYNQEIGFAWQIRSDAYVNYTNEPLAILQSYENFSSALYDDVFNGNGYHQSYHQFSVSVRENYNKRLAFGLKFSLLSGISYNSLDLRDSHVFADISNDRVDIGLTGSYKGTFIQGDELEQKMLYPLFKNPGLSTSFGANYQSRSGIFFMGNIKDLGFLYWNKTSHVANVNSLKSIYRISRKPDAEVRNEIIDIVYDADERKGFFTLTNAKADFMISKTFNFYKPSLIVSKNLFHFGGEAAFVNTFTLNQFSASLTPAYNLINAVSVGIQGMYQTPNFEVFLGTDNLGKTVSTARGLSRSDGTIGTGYSAASFYMGMGIKFGRTVEHPMNFSRMPGVGGERVYNGFFRSLFDFFKF